MEEDSLARFLNPPFFSFAEMETRLPILAQGPRRPAPGMPGGTPAKFLTRALSKMHSTVFAAVSFGIVGTQTSIPGKVDK